MACLLHAPLRSSIVKKSTKSRTFWMPDVMDEVVNSNTSCTGRATLTLMTHGSITKTCMHPTFSKNSILPTPLRLDELKYKDPVHSPNQSLSSSLTHRNNYSKDLSAAFISISCKSTCLTLPPQFLSPHALPLWISPIQMQATLRFPQRPLLLLRAMFQSH